MRDYRVRVFQGGTDAVTRVLIEFGNKTRGEDPVIHFYEHFLSAYDKQLKRKLVTCPHCGSAKIEKALHAVRPTHRAGDLMAVDVAVANQRGATTLTVGQFNSDISDEYPDVDVTKVAAAILKSGAQVAGVEEGGAVEEAVALARVRDVLERLAEPAQLVDYNVIADLNGYDGFDVADPQFAGQHYTRPQGAGVLAYANLGGALGGACFGWFMHRFGIKRATQVALGMSALLVAWFGTGQTTLIQGGKYGVALDALGQHLTLDEKYFDALTALGGSPARRRIADTRNPNGAATLTTSAPIAPRPTTPSVLPWISSP